MDQLGKKVWAIAEGYIPQWGQGKMPEMDSHETLCILNANKEATQIEMIVYFPDQPPVGPYRWEVEGERTKHVRLNELQDPQRIPPGKDFSCVLRASLPVVVQHSRLDSRQNANALMTTLAYAQ